LVPAINSLSNSVASHTCASEWLEAKLETALYESEAFFYLCQKFNAQEKVQECDATMPHSNLVLGSKKNKESKVATGKYSHEKSRLQAAKII
jgi:hypothetical protein